MPEEDAKTAKFSLIKWCHWQLKFYINCASFFFQLQAILFKLMTQNYQLQFYGDVIKLTLWYDKKYNVELQYSKLQKTQS